MSLKNKGIRIKKAFQQAKTRDFTKIKKGNRRDKNRFLSKQHTHIKEPTEHPSPRSYKISFLIFLFFSHVSNVNNKTDVLVLTLRMDICRRFLYQSYN